MPVDKIGKNAVFTTVIAATIAAKSHPVMMSHDISVAEADVQQHVIVMRGCFGA